MYILKILIFLHSARNSTSEQNGALDIDATENETRNGKTV